MMLIKKPSQLLKLIMKLEMLPVHKVGKKFLSYTTGQELENTQIMLLLMSKNLTLGEVVLSALEELLKMNLLL